MFKVRVSKYRHLYGSSGKKEQWYEGIRAPSNAQDNNLCEVNPKYMSIITESTGGGVFVVLPLSQTGRLKHSSDEGKVIGHRGPVNDIKWCPHDDDVIASCSDDLTVKIWRIPDGGIHEPLEESTHTLIGHHRRVTKAEWHPLVQYVIVSIGLDYNVIVWNSSREEAVYKITCHHDVIFSVAWSPCGRHIATTCKDKVIRVIDPRKGTVVAEGEGHEGRKSSKVTWVGEDVVLTTGFSRNCDRQYALWSVKDFSKPLANDTIDFSSGVLTPYYDPDTRVLFLAGKGDGNIRFYEIVPQSPYIYYLGQLQSSNPQKGLGWMCKRGVDVRKCEIARFYKLHSNKHLCEPISVIVPRKGEGFQEDLFPPTNSYHSNISTAEWFNGFNREPDKVSLYFDSPAKMFNAGPPTNLQATAKPSTPTPQTTIIHPFTPTPQTTIIQSSTITSPSTITHSSTITHPSTITHSSTIKPLSPITPPFPHSDQTTKPEDTASPTARGCLEKVGAAPPVDGVRLRNSTSTGPGMPASIKNIHRLSSLHDRGSYKDAFYHIGHQYEMTSTEDEVARLKGELRVKEALIQVLQEENYLLKCRLRGDDVTECVKV